MTTPAIGECWLLPVIVVQVNAERAIVHLLTPDGEGDLPDVISETGRTFGLPISVPVEYLREREEQKP